jgi:ABC-type sugar transport system substrate-binding protein
MGLGVSRAIANAGKTGQIKVISVDGNKDAFEVIKAGGVDAVVAQYPYVIGAMGVEACQAAMAGKTLPASVKAPVQVVTKTNFDAALSAAPKPGGSYDDPFAALLK